MRGEYCAYYALSALPKQLSVHVTAVLHRIDVANQPYRCIAKLVLPSPVVCATHSRYLKILGFSQQDHGLFWGGTRYCTVPDCTVLLSMSRGLLLLGCLGWYVAHDSND